jgi:hypothetical protein
VPSTVSTHSLLPLYVRPCFTKHRSNQRGPLLKIYQNKPNPKILPLQIMSGGISYSPTVWKTSMFLNDLIKTSKQRSMLCFFWGKGHPTKQEMMSATLRSAGKFWDGFWATIAQRAMLVTRGSRMVQVKHTKPRAHGSAHLHQ